ncbi:CPBP family intramembrane glutamic endopeptidase [Austwickia chelonae]|uniref:CPBP family intramembrane glutamic endopeptidase n=1 Tax=Austwickia chelonae TaxID=100225 RepID=UPI000E22BDE5|nr:CPBP family intramembrane glutamic endopeptidase [Austwickia chelonae]
MPDPDLHTHHVNDTRTSGRGAAQAGRWGTDYFRMATRSPRYRWWVPLIEVALLYVGYLALVFVVVMIATALKLVAPDHTNFIQGVGNQAGIAPSKPIDFTLTTLSLIILVPAAMFAVRYGGRRPVGGLFAVCGWLNTSLLWRSTKLILPVYVVSTAVPMFFFDYTFSITASALIGALLVVILIPLQAAAEEVAFRGLMGQVLGAWTKTPVIPIVLPVIPFLLAHSYDFSGMFALAVFSICMGILLWVTGGLEIPMVMHAISNMTALFPVAFGAGAVSDTVSLTVVVYQSALTIGLTVLIILRPQVVGVTSWKTSSAPEGKTAS